MVWVKTYDEFVTHIESTGLPVAVSFDNDLGEAKEGVDCARWLFNWCADNNLDMVKFAVHSANPICAKEIHEILGADWEKYKKQLSK